MIVKKEYSDGLTTVELLVALFVAGIFLISGYQLYTYIFRSGTQTTVAAEVSNAVYAKMRAKAASITPGSCVPSTNGPGGELYNGSTIKNIVIVTTIACPYTNDTLKGINKITSTANYSVAGSAQETITHAIYK
jgi:Tfp pilus assembly protein FimT